MNKLIINGVTIECSPDLVISIADNVVTVRQPSIKERVLATPVMVMKDEPTELPAPANPRKNGIPLPKPLPSNVDQLILRYMRTQGGKAYAIGISSMLKKHMRLSKMSYPYSQMIRQQLETMLDVGVIVDLNHSRTNGGLALYALPSMIKDTRVNDDTNRVERVSEQVD